MSDTTTNAQYLMQQHSRVTPEMNYVSLLRHIGMNLFGMSMFVRLYIGGTIRILNT